jgi:hypothetical protein
MKIGWLAAGINPPLFRKITLAAVAHVPVVQATFISPGASM